MQLLIATKNQGKFKEISAAMAELPLEILSLNDLGIAQDFEEIGETFEENALGKAKFFYELSGFLTLADDSGIEIPVLKGELGIKTRRWGGENVSDEEWITKFLKRMEEFADFEQRKAKFICAAAIFGKMPAIRLHSPRKMRGTMEPAGENFVEKIFRGEAAGTIMKSLEAPLTAGIPLSSCFKPDGFDRVYSALTPEEKSVISHRGLAVSKVKEWLKDKVKG